MKTVPVALNGVFDVFVPKKFAVMVGRFMKPKISIVIPMHNEESVVEEFLSRLEHSLIDDYDFQVVAVDDGSTDRTWDLLSQSLNGTCLDVIVRLTRNFGKEAAIRAGLEKATGDAVITIDADLQHPVSLIPQMIAKWSSTGVGIVEGVKARRGEEGLFYSLGAGVFYSIMNKVLNLEFGNSSDFKLIDRKVVDALLALPERKLFFRALTSWTGYEKEQIEFSVAPRAGGEKSFTILKLVQLFVDAIVSFTSLPLQAVSISGVVFLFFAVILAVQTVVNYLSGGAVSGFTTVILLQLIIGSVVTLGLGMIGVYVAKIYDEIKCRPRYLVAEAKVSASREETS